jgi:hypothetical protein
MEKAGNVAAHRLDPLFANVLGFERLIATAETGKKTLPKPIRFEGLRKATEMLGSMAQPSASIKVGKHGEPGLRRKDFIEGGSPADIRVQRQQPMEQRGTAPTGADDDDRFMECAHGRHLMGQ